VKLDPLITCKLDHLIKDINLEYDPVKFKLAKMLGRSNTLRHAFHLVLETIFLRAWYVRRELWRLLRHIGPSPKILDAGMGFGQYSDRMMRIFTNADLIGLEIDRKHLYGNEKYFQLVHPKTRFVIGDVQALPVGEDNFDLILSVDVMEHIEDDVATFRGFYRILNPGGRVIIHTPRIVNENDAHLSHADREADDHEWTVDEHFRDGYTDSQARERLEAAGFEIERIVHGYGFFGKIAWNLLQRIPMSMLGMSQMMIFVVAIYLLVATPIAIVAMLLDMIPGEQPNGGSLLVVAQKPK
jgi:SAM-dependent methyltransferase